MSFTEKDIEKLAKSDLFCHSQKEELARVLRNHQCHVKVFTDGEVILSPETTQRTAGILLEGKAVVHTPDPSRKMLLRFLDRGEPFGIANLFSEDRFVSIIHAHGDCRVFFLAEDAIGKLLESDRNFLFQYLGFLSGRIRYLNQKIGYLSAGSAERRLAIYLASFGEQNFRLPISISALSELLDVGRASLYRAFDRLEADGFLIKAGRNFTLPDRETMLNMYQ